MVTYISVILIEFVLCLLAYNSLYEAKDEVNNETKIAKTNITKVFLGLAVFTLIFTAGCRYHVGTDYKTYISLFSIYKRMQWKEFFTLDEPLLPLIAKIGSMFYSEYVSMFILTSAITVGIALISIYRETNDFLFVTLLYIFVGCWHGSFNAVKQCLAVAIVFAGRKFIEERKFWKYALICFVAFLAHSSAVIAVLFYFLPSKEFSWVKMIGIALVTIIVALSYDRIFGFIGWLNDSEFEMTEYTERSVNVLRTLAGSAPAILALYLAATKKLKERQIFYVYMLVANASMRIATSGSAYLARIVAYTSIFVPIGLSSVLEVSNKKAYKPLRIVIVILYFAFWLYEITLSQTLFEFEWFFGKPMI